MPGKQTWNKDPVVSARSAKNYGNTAGEYEPPESVTRCTQAARHGQPGSPNTTTPSAAMEPFNNNNRIPFSGPPDTGVSKSVKEVLNGLLQSGIIERIREDPSAGGDTVPNNHLTIRDRTRYAWIGRQPCGIDEEESSEGEDDTDSEQDL